VNLTAPRRSRLWVFLPSVEFQTVTGALAVGFAEQSCEFLRQDVGLDGCYRPRYLNIQRLNYLWTIRLSSARIAGNLIT
jgi:hypothetical protein